MKKVKAKLTIEIEYENHVDSNGGIAGALGFAARHLAERGHLDVEDANLVGWDYSVDIDDETAKEKEA